MKTRVITAIVGILVLIAVLFTYATPIFNLAVAALTLIAVYELFGAMGFGKAEWPLLAVWVPAVLCVDLIGMPAVLPAAYFLMIWLGIYLVVKKLRLSYVKAAGMYLYAAFVTGSFYAMVFLKNALPAERYSNDGIFFTLLALCYAWGGDTFAYFAGVAFGRHKLCPEVSPKKTVEGAVGGILGSMLCGWILTIVYAEFFGRAGDFASSAIGVPMYVIMAVLGMVSAVLGIFGDLTASVVKRQAEIKDYGNLFPGHGGVMDRFDSVTFILPLVAIAVNALYI